MNILKNCKVRGLEELKKAERRLKDFKKLNILIAEHEVECVKELKRQKDELFL